MLGILLVFTAAYAVTFARGTVRQRAALRTASKADADASGHANDALVNHETVKLFGAEDFINGRIDAALARSETGWRAYYREQGRNGVVLAVLFAAAWLALAVSTPLAKAMIDARLPVAVQVSVPVLGVVGWLAARELVREAASERSPAPRSADG